MTLGDQEVVLAPGSCPACDPDPLDFQLNTKTYQLYFDTSKQSGMRCRPRSSRPLFQRWFNGAHNPPPTSRSPGNQSAHGPPLHIALPVTDQIFESLSVILRNFFLEFGELASFTLFHDKQNALAFMKDAMAAQSAELMGQLCLDLEEKTNAVVRRHVALRWESNIFLGSCHNCGHKGHGIDDCDQPIICLTCGGVGHSYLRCSIAKSESLPFRDGHSADSLDLYNILASRQEVLWDNLSNRPLKSKFGESVGLDAASKTAFEQETIWNSLPHRTKTQRANVGSQKQAPFRNPKNVVSDFHKRIEHCHDFGPILYLLAEVQMQMGVVPHSIAVAIFIKLMVELDHSVNADICVSFLLQCLRQDIVFSLDQWHTILNNCSKGKGPSLQRIVELLVSQPYEDVPIYPLSWTFNVILRAAHQKQTNTRHIGLSPGLMQLITDWNGFIPSRRILLGLCKECSTFNDAIKIMNFVEKRSKLESEGGKFADFSLRFMVFVAVAKIVKSHKENGILPLLRDSTDSTSSLNHVSYSNVITFRMDPNQTTRTVADQRRRTNVSYFSLEIHFSTLFSLNFHPTCIISGKSQLNNGTLFTIFSNWWDGNLSHRNSNKNYILTQIDDGTNPLRMQTDSEHDIIGDLLVKTASISRHSFHCSKSFIDVQMHCLNDPVSSIWKALEHQLSIEIEGQRAGYRLNFIRMADVIATLNELKKFELDRIRDNVS